MSVQKCPQFAVNSQLATRNPQPAVLLSPQGRVGTRTLSTHPFTFALVAVPSRSGQIELRVER
ncbi:hypothetical protein Q2T83_14010 [Fervidibacter sacchari]|uniref:hypothetical protein n=1 Tax=Candidatus Fervidibacter sacchari TaxID=1448929 RepID=UPI00216858A5|nr:hypothetical protein [Candidatus Fervidibacter sacchari]WKU15437.1 hypothetical protein Q2T83_14010 [Candidatus Fervidibacter sacchari]